MSNNIEVGGSLIAGTVDTPLDARGRVVTLAEVAAIENPFVGMLFYCLADGVTYVVWSLKSKVIGSMTVPNAQIDQYVRLSPEYRTAVMSQAEYDALTEKSGTTLYYILEAE